MGISAIDWAIIAVYLLATLVFGIALGRSRDGRAGTTVDYFLGSRQLPWWALLLSIVATETSTATFLSIPGTTYRSGGNFSFLQWALGLLIGRVVVAIVFLPLYFHGELLTSYELLESRFGVATRRLSSLLFLVTRTIGDALRLFLCALILHNIMGINMSLCILVVGGITIAYTLVGGMRSVVWNDCIQFGVYLGGAIWAFYTLSQMVPDGWSGIYQYGVANDKFTWVVWPSTHSPGSYTLVLGLIGGAFFALASHGTDHIIVQRLLGSRSQADAARALILSGFVVLCQFALFLAIGVGLGYFYETYPPLVPFTTTDDVFASFVIDHLQPGVVGVVIAAIFAAAMSTQSSSLNASANALVGDFYQPLFRPESSQADLVRVGKLATLIFGLLQVGVAIAAQEYARQRSVVENVLGLASFTYGPVLGLFLLAACARRMHPVTGFLSFGCGLLVLIILKGLSYGAAPIVTIHSFWYVTIGSLCTAGVGIIIDRIMPSSLVRTKKTH